MNSRSENDFFPVEGREALKSPREYRPLRGKSGAWEAEGEDLADVAEEPDIRACLAERVIHMYF